MTQDTEDVVALVDAIARIIEPCWFTDDGRPPLVNNYPDQHVKYQERAREQARAIIEMVGQSLSDRIDELESAIGKARIQISGGLCYFSAEAKHAQLADADRTLADALGEKSLTDAAKSRAALHQEGIAPE